ncbi:hypothetical protein CRUP_004627 [Coryphaenoides rupestris]|nr:hypothetical protein CRUP_004627 [Coryphaenoides rupestris]
MAADKGFKPQEALRHSHLLAVIEVEHCNEAEPDVRDVVAKVQDEAGVWLILDLCGQVEARFNKHHAQARSIIERTFGMLKTRWRAIFLRALGIQTLFAPKVIAACCILHNLCLSTDDILEDGEEDEEYHEED